MAKVKGKKRTKTNWIKTREMTDNECEQEMLKTKEHFYLNRGTIKTFNDGQASLYRCKYALTPGIECKCKVKVWKLEPNKNLKYVSALEHNHPVDTESRTNLAHTQETKEKLYKTIENNTPEQNVTLEIRQLRKYIAGGSTETKQNAEERNYKKATKENIQEEPDEKENRKEEIEVEMGKELYKRLRNIIEELLKALKDDIQRMKTEFPQDIRKDLVKQATKEIKKKLTEFNEKLKQDNQISFEILNEAKNDGNKLKQMIIPTEEKCEENIKQEKEKKEKRKKEWEEMNEETKKEIKQLKEENKTIKQELLKLKEEMKELKKKQNTPEQVTERESIPEISGSDTTHILMSPSEIYKYLTELEGEKMKD